MKRATVESASTKETTPSQSTVGLHSKVPSAPVADSASSGMVVAAPPTATRIRTGPRFRQSRSRPSPKTGWSPFLCPRQSSDKLSPSWTSCARRSEFFTNELVIALKLIDDNKYIKNKFQNYADKGF